MKRNELFQTIIMVQGGLLVVALLLGWGLDAPFWNDVRFETSAYIWGIGSGILLAACSMIILELPGKWLAPIRRDADVAFKTMGAQGLIEIVVIAIAAGVSEEMFFRGLLQPLVAQWTGPWVAIVLVAALFGVMHFVSFSYVLYAIVFGAVFGILYFLTENLLIAILAHTVYDFIFLFWGIHVRKIHLKGIT